MNRHASDSPFCGLNASLLVLLGTYSQLHVMPNRVDFSCKRSDWIRLVFSHLSRLDSGDPIASNGGSGSVHYLRVARKGRGRVSLQFHEEGASSSFPHLSCK